MLQLLKRSTIDKVDYITEKLFSQSGSWEAQDDGPKVSVNSVPNKTSFPSLQMANFLLCLHMVKRDRELFGVSLYKGTNPIVRSPFS